MPKMTDNELLSLVSEAERQAAVFSGDLMRENTKYLEAYFGYKTGDFSATPNPVSYTHLRAHETREDIVCRLLLEKKKK